MLLPSPTDRLILRCWQDEDFPAFARMNADSRVMEYFPAPHPPGIRNGKVRTLRPRTSHGRGAAGLYGTSPGHVRRTVVRPGGNRLATAQRHVGQRVCHGSGPKLSSLRQPVENGIHYLFHRLEQSALTTGHATARYDTITGIRPPRTTNGTSSATARPVHDPDERIRRDRTGNPAGKPSIKPTTPSNLRAAAGKISRQRLALQYPKTLDQDRSTARGTFEYSNNCRHRIFHRSRSQTGPCPGLPAQTMNRNLIENSTVRTALRIRILSSRLKTGPAEVLALWPTRPFEAA